jgi:hypothetical protein
MSLPERRPVVPDAIYPREQQSYGHVTPYSSNIEQVRVVYVQSATDPSVSVPVDARLLQPAERTPERNLTPQPLIDPIAQRLGCGALLAVAVGVAGWLLFTPWAAVCIGSIAVIVVALRLPAGRRGGDTINVTNHNRWWGRSSSDIK